MYYSSMPLTISLTLSPGPAKAIFSSSSLCIETSYNFSQLGIITHYISGLT